jgi:hypothetical protein
MKPENMKSVTRSATNIDQKDRGLGFDGLDNSEQKSKSTKWASNQHAGRQDPNKTVNFGRGATVGNTGKTANEGPKQPPVSRVPDFRAGAKKAFAGTFNAGSQDRTPGGTRSWAPSATENYRGNIDMIDEKRGPTKGNKQ